MYKMVAITVPGYASAGVHTEKKKEKENYFG